MEEKINKIQNASNKFKFKYFPNVEKVDLTKIKITTEGVYSVSDNIGSSKLVSLIERYFKSKDLIITDTTGNNGSDTIALGLNFTHVNSIEIDPTNFIALQHNVKKVYNLNNVDLYNGNSIEILKKLNQDVIYVDPPWGGSDYKNSEHIELYMDGKSMGEIFNEFRSNTKLFVFKLPKNYNFTKFIQMTLAHKYQIYLHKRKEKPRYFLFFVSTKE